MATARITSKGQITVPKQVRDRLGIEPGDALEFHFEDGRLEVRPVRRRRLKEFRGLFRGERVLDFRAERKLAWEAQSRQLAEGDRAADA